MNALSHTSCLDRHLHRSALRRWHMAVATRGHLSINAIHNRIHDSESDTLLYTNIQ